MNIVGNAEPLVVSRGGAAGGDVSTEPVFGVLDLGRSSLVVVISIDVEVGNMVSEISHVLLAARCSRAARIRRAHVGREEAEDVA